MNYRLPALPLTPEGEFLPAMDGPFDAKPLPGLRTPGRVGHKATDIEIGLLLNFGKKPEFKRKIHTNMEHG